MKYNTLLVVLLTLVGSSLFAQISDTAASEKYLRNKVLEDIQTSLNKKNQLLDSTIARLDLKVNDLDKSIRETSNVKEKADKLLERVQALENKQKAIEENELNVYQANYQSAIVNLIYMDREIKPLLLFNSTKDFFDLLSQASNPMSYPGYDDWIKKFKTYIDQHKSKEANLDVLSNFVNTSNDITKAIPLTGPVTQLFFTGIESFINSSSQKHKEEREQGEKMFLLLTKLSQFSHDKTDVEHDWLNITKELKGLQLHYDSILSKNLDFLGISKSDYNKRFSTENDAEKRYNYLTFIRQRAARLVDEQKRNAPKEWKEGVYFELMDIQSLKQRFGRITFLISNYIDSYHELLKKYSDDPQIGKQMVLLEKKLTDVKDIFDVSFRPTDYLDSATRMYKVD